MNGEQELTVSTIMMEEYWGEVDDDEEEVGEVNSKSE